MSVSFSSESPLNLTFELVIVKYSLVRMTMQRKHRHRCHMAAKFGLFVDENHSKLTTLYWLP